MAENSNIEWTDHTFNPWTQCTPVSTGCQNCYASAISKRFTGESYKKGIPRQRTSEANWKQPLKWNRAAEKTGVRARVFCASLADVFDEEAPHEWRVDLFNLIVNTPNLDWLLLTKRPENVMPMTFAMKLSHLGEDVPIWDNLPNVWLGTSVENQKAADERIPYLLNIPARVRFLSCEPLLGPVNLESVFDYESEVAYKALSGRVITSPRDEEGGSTCGRIDWVICGGESGHNARIMHPGWARSLRDQCIAASVPFLFKQWGEHAPITAFDGPIPIEIPAAYVLDDPHFSTQSVYRIGKKRAGRLLDGRTWDEFPDSSKLAESVSEKEAS